MLPCRAFLKGDNSPIFLSVACFLTLILSACSHIQPPPAESKYANLSLGIPGKADTIIDRPGYALDYIEYHEQPAWVIYRRCIMAK